MPCTVVQDEILSELHYNGQNAKTLTKILILQLQLNILMRGNDGHQFLKFVTVTILLNFISRQQDNTRKRTQDLTSISATLHESGFLPCLTAVGFKD